MKKAKECFVLFLTMLKIGLFTFGGGYAMIALLENEFVSKRRWLDKDEFLDMAAIAESTPGPIANNCATFTGYRQAGFVGALVATLGMIIPSFSIIYAISMFLDNFLEIAVIAHAFKGIKIAVGLLILDAAITMIRKMHKKILPRAIMLTSAAIMLMINLCAWNFSSISLMLAAAAVSLSIFLVQKNNKAKGEQKK